MSLLPVGFGSAADDDYEITDSLRLRSSASAYLNRTFASAGNRKTWTWSGWVKRGKLSDYQALFCGGDATSNNDAWLRLGAASGNVDAIEFRNITGGSYTANVYTSAVFRDPSAWYHIVIVIDTTQATSTNRIKIYVNSEQQTLTFALTPAQNADMSINAAGLHTISKLNFASVSYLDAYLTEVNFIDGQALDPTDFGEYDDNGTWKAKEYTGTYGTNGFYLNGVGVTDQSGNGNNWTNNNLNLSTSTATTYDQMKDTPSLVDENAGNFATLNPLYNSISTSYPTPALSEGNLAASTNSGSNWKTVPSTMYVSSGKWYAEVKVTYTDYPDSFIGFASSDFNGQNYAPSETAFGYQFHPSLGIRHNSTQLSAGTFTQGDVIGLALNMDNNELSWYKNGTLVYTATSVASGYWSIALTLIYTKTLYVNFGQRPFAYTPPTGFLKLNTFNLPDSTIEDGSDYFNTVLYTGTGFGSIQNVTGVGFQPDLVWTKARSFSTSHEFYDVIRGVSKPLLSNTNLAELSWSPYGLVSFDSDGFGVNDLDVNGYGINELNRSYVGWSWKANGSGVSNTVGNIPSTVSANTTAGFSIVTHTGNGSLATIGHGLGVAPSMFISKSRSSAFNWHVYHASIGNTKALFLNLTDAAITSINYFNNTSPTSTVFTLNSAINSASNNYVTYCFAPIEGYSSFGSYTGNGSTDGPFVYTGFRPAFVIFKSSNQATNWMMFDATVNPVNEAKSQLWPNLANAENTNSVGIDFLSNGIKLRGALTATNAATSYNYIYMAFAENPFKNALAR